MTEYFEGLEELHAPRELLPEDEGETLRTIHLTKEILSSPRAARPDLVGHAIEGWENLQTHLSESCLADLVGEVIELLEGVFRRHHITFEEAQRGKRTVNTLTRFLGLSSRRGYEP